MRVNVSQVNVLDANGKSKSLGDFKGKVILIVNVASQCGFTKQYAGLQSLQNIYGDRGFAIIAFPCNDFGAQEPGSVDEVKAFCQKTFNTNFEIFEKVHAKGATTEPYSTLNNAEPKGDVAWNFEKFLINKNGEVIGRYKSNIEPESQELKSAIENALIAE
tara:strand:+ start:2532 stop:3014 length:483 start_codon:yes stop_codon:yes gene_type:complete